MQNFGSLFTTLAIVGVISMAPRPLGFPAVSPAAAQTSPAGPEQTAELVTFFYKDPRPERLIGFFEQFESPAAPRNWEAYPPLVGFFATVFRAYPDHVERLIPARFNPRSAVTIAAALSLSGNGSMIAKLQPQLDGAASDETLRAELAGLPARLEDLRVRTPTHLDIMWGAAFASGDDRFVLAIASFFAQTANRSEQVAADVTKVVLALTGGPREILTELRGRYGDAGAIEIAFAATALWALQSNAMQHPFVESFVTKYIARNAGTPAVKALSMLRLREKQR